MILKFVVAYGALVPHSDFFASRDGRTAEMQRLLESKAREQLLSKMGSLKSNLSPSERRLFYGERVRHQHRVDAGWRLEAFQTLIWALGLIEQIPAYDTEADPAILKLYPPEAIATYAKTAQLRPKQEIERARDLAELWHWRSRTRQLIEQGAKMPKTIPEARSYDDIVRMTARRAFTECNIDALIDDDFPARGMAYRDLPPAEWAIISSIARERHFALNWLCGYARRDRWDGTPTKT